MYGYKIDIKNYFNSVDISIIINNLKKDIKDEQLLNLLISIGSITGSNAYGSMIVFFVPSGSTISK